MPLELLIQPVYLLHPSKRFHSVIVCQRGSLFVFMDEAAHTGRGSLLPAVKADVGPISAAVKCKVGSCKTHQDPGTRGPTALLRRPINLKVH